MIEESLRTYAGYCGPHKNALQVFQEEEQSVNIALEKPSVCTSSR